VSRYASTDHELNAEMMRRNDRF